MTSFPPLPLTPSPSLFLLGQPKLRSIVTEVFEGVLESRVKCGACKKVTHPATLSPSSLFILLSLFFCSGFSGARAIPRPLPANSRYMCTHSLLLLRAEYMLRPPPSPPSGRKEMAKSRHRTEKEPTDPRDTPTSGRSGGTFSRGLCTVINLVSQVRDMFSGPPTIIQDCLDAFFDPSELKGRFTSSIHSTYHFTQFCTETYTHSV